jgi:predicted nucleotidyltransferase
MSMHLVKLVKALKEKKVNYMIVGGYAVNFHGYSRNTVDIDLIIKFTLANLKKVERLLGEMGMISRLPIDAVSIFKFRDEYVKNRNLIAWNFYNENDPMDQVDILINHDVSDFKTEKFLVGNLELKVISKEDLLKMKKKSGRDKDLIDIRELTK